MLPVRRHPAFSMESGSGCNGWRALRRHALLAKCLLAGCVAVTLMIVAFSPTLPAPDCAFASKHLSMGASNPRYHGSAVKYQDRFTLMLNTYQRHELLKRSLAHYSKCEQIDAIRVIWAEDGLPPSRAESPAFYSELKDVRYDIMPTSSLNHRFHPVEGLRTEAVFSIDDDILAPCSVLSQAFEVWQRNKGNLVGFYPRLHLQDSSCRLWYVSSFLTTFWYGRYSIILTKAAFLHRASHKYIDADYLELYTHHMPADIRHFVDEKRNCEDLAMQFLVADRSGLPPIFVHSSQIIDLGKGLFKVQGISSQANHMQSRSQCLNILESLFQGVVPLKSRAIKEHQDGWLLRLSPFWDFFHFLFRGR